ncbi:MAG: polyhydroxyalkanoic acid system family protein [Burkholderiaceae bacterium]|nr:polyhydroxyalkanoic acid system family protein [Burkholderiaceae bacterium]
MSDIKVVRHHALPLAKARAMAQEAADALAAEYNLTSEWHGNTLRFHRAGVDGVMHVKATQIQLEVTLGFLLKAFKGKLVEHIERNFDKLMPEREVEAPARKATKTTAKKATRRA